MVSSVPCLTEPAGCLVNQAMATGWLSKTGDCLSTPIHNAIYSTRYGCAWQVAGRVRARERAQAARLLHRRHLLVAGRLALRHVVHLHMDMVWWIVLVRGGC